MRERRDEELQLEPLACDGGGEGAIVGLHGARRPVELEEAAAWGLLLRELPFPHKAAHRRIGSRVALLGDEPAGDLLRAVALLPGDGAVVHEHADDKIGVPVDCRPLPPFRHRRLRGEVLHPRILVHAAAAHAKGLRYLGRPGSVGIHPSDTLLYVRGHGHLSFPPSGGTFVAVLPARKELWGHGRDLWLMCGEMPCPVNGMCRNRSSGRSIPGDITVHFLLKENTRDVPSLPCPCRHERRGHG